MVGLFVAMHHSKHKFAVVQHLVVKIPTIITIGEIMNNKKPSNSLNLLGLFENTGGDERIRTSDQSFSPDAPLAGECLRPARPRLRISNSLQRQVV